MKDKKMDIFKGKYFVCSEGDTPLVIKFNEEEAKAGLFEYIDVFNEEGTILYSLKLEDEGNNYTKDF